MERLSPEERAAFILREVLGADYAELARVLDKSEPACRQMVHRARGRVRDERRRASTPASAATKRDLVERFLRALQAEDKDELLAVVAPDATYISDGGGRMKAARRIVQGSDRLVRLVLGLARKRPAMRDEVSLVNGEPALVSHVGPRLAASMSFDVSDGRIVGIYRVVNPEKLRHLYQGGGGDGLSGGQ